MFYCFIYEIQQYFLLSVSGGLFGEDEDPSIEAAFRYAVHNLNQDPNILGQTNIVSDIQQIPEYSSFLAARKGKANHILFYPCYISN